VGRLLVRALNNGYLVGISLFHLWNLIEVALRDSLRRPWDRKKGCIMHMSLISLATVKVGQLCPDY